MAGKTAVIIGGAGGLGGELLQHALTANGFERVLATHRYPTSSPIPRLEWLLLDFCEPAHLQRFRTQVAERVQTIDLFICASGWLHGPQQGAEQGGSPEKDLKALQPAQLGLSYQVNAAGPLCAFAACAPGLRAARAPRALFLSAQVGSIEDNGLGGWYGYRMAKAALNMGVKSAAIEASRWRNAAAIVAVHPGTTHSALSKPFVARRRAPVATAAVSAQRLWDLANSLTEEHNGTFVTNQGQPLPW